MLYAKAYNVVVVQLNNKETAHNKYMNILYDKQQYWFRRLTTIKKCSNLHFTGKRKGGKRLPSSFKIKQKWLIGIS